MDEETNSLASSAGALSQVLFNLPKSVILDTEFLSQNSDQLAAFLNGKTVQLFDVNTGKSIGKTEFSNDAVQNGFTANSNLVSLCSARNGSVSVIDTRDMNNKPSMSIDLSGINATHKLNCLSLNSTEQLLAVGTQIEVVKSKASSRNSMMETDTDSLETSEAEVESIILFVDLRNTAQIMGCYRDSHSDDVNALRFHPTLPNWLLSGGADGLTNVFNVAKSTEDDALQQSLNSESAVARVGWAGGVNPSGRTQSIPFNHLAYAVTDDSQMFIWNAETGDQIAALTNGPDLKDGNNENNNSNAVSSGGNSNSKLFVVDAFSISEGQNISNKIPGAGDGSGIMMGGAVTTLASPPQGGKPHILTFSSAGPLNQNFQFRQFKPIKNSKGHSDLIRCCAWSPSGRLLVTGGDDGRICMTHFEEELVQKLSNISLKITQNKRNKKKIGKLSHTKPY